MRGGVREWELVAEEKEIEVAPGVKYAAWAYNGRVPGPTLRAREGERLRIRFVNAADHPHTIHFHGIHTARMDGVPGVGAGNIEPGQRHGLRVRRRAVRPPPLPLPLDPAGGPHREGPLRRVRDRPARTGRPKADELVMVMNGFDTNFDRSNEIYAVNTVAFAYQQEPIRVKRGELVRIYLVNALEFDLVNSFHVHANFFDYFPTGTSLEPTELTDTVIQGQGQRGILELRFPYEGKYMFHAHVSEFAELGLDGLLRGRVMEATTATRRTGPGWLAALAAARPARRADRLLHRARRAGARAQRGAGRGGRGRAHRAAPGRDRAAACETTGRTRSQIVQAIVNDGFAGVRAGRRRARPARPLAGDDRLPVDRGRGLRGRPAHVDRRDGGHVDRGGRGDARGGRRLLRPDGPDRPLRGDHPGGDRDALAAVDAAARQALAPVPARAHDRAARLPRHRRRARGPRAGRVGRRVARRRCAHVARRGARVPRAGGGRRLARAARRAVASGSRCSSRSASACTTSARAS